MMQSMETEPISTDQRGRIDDIPVGLKNVGNTCYFNSFMQAFFFLPNLQSKFTQANVKKIQQLQRADSKGDPVVESRRLASVEMVSQLQKLFVAMLYTN
jgi:ubiquitin carboxyl-terminal hydrolase 25